MKPRETFVLAGGLLCGLALLAGCSGVTLPTKCPAGTTGTWPLCVPDNPPPDPPPGPPAHGAGPECAASGLAMGCWNLPPRSPTWVWVCVHQFANGPTPSVDRPGSCPCPRSQDEIALDPTAPACSAPASPHPICTVEVPRITDCYHNPTGKLWLYACPPLDGSMLNVEWGKEATCPKGPPAPPDPGPSPTPVPGCSFPQGLPENAFTFTPSRGQLQARVNFAVSIVGGGCPIGSACPLGPDPQAALVKIVAELRKAGLCAGQDLESGPVEKRSDQLNVSLDCGTEWESYHSVKWPQAAGDQAMAVWASRPSESCLGGRDAGGIPKDLGCPGVGGGSYRGDLSIPPNRCAPPVVDACPVTPGMLDGHEPFRAAVKPHGPGVDLTLWGCGAAVVATLDPGHVPGTTGAHSCLNFCCPFEQDKGTGPCADKLWGKAAYSVVPPNSTTLTIEPTANTNTVRLAGSGVVKLCGTVRPDDAAACWIFDYPCKPDAVDSTKCQKDKR